MKLSHSRNDISNLPRSPRETPHPILLASGIAGLLCASITSATTSAAAAAPRYAGQSISVLIGAPGGTTAKGTQQLFKAWANTFHTETGATVNYEYFTSGEEETSMIEAAIVAGSGPDLMNYGSSYIGTLEQTKEFPPLTPAEWRALGGKSSFVSSMLDDSGTTPSNELGVPFEDNAYVMAYNTKYFHEAGITTAPTTWNAFVTDAQTIQKDIPGVYGAAINPEDPFVAWKSIYLMNKAGGGGHWVTDNGTKADIASQATYKAISFYFALDYLFHVVPPESLTWNSSQSYSAFLSGKVAMVPAASTGFLSSVPTSSVKGHVAYAPIPTVPFGDKTLPANGLPDETTLANNLFAIPGYVTGSQRNLSLAFLRVVLSPGLQLKQFELDGQLPVTKPAIAVVESKHPVATAFLQAAAHSVLTSTAPIWNYIEPGINTVLTRAATHLATTGKWSEAYVRAQLLHEQQAADASV